MKARSIQPDRDTLAKTSRVRCCAGVLFLLLLSPVLLHAQESSVSLRFGPVLVHGKPVNSSGTGSVALGSHPEDVTFTFGSTGSVANLPLRMRYTLQGHEQMWHEGGSDMGFTVRFYNHSGDVVSQTLYSVRGESTGWKGSLTTSSLTHRRETLLVPPQAERIQVVISSAGPPDSVGIFVVANLVISTADEQNVVLFSVPFEADESKDTSDSPPPGWIQTGIMPSMAKIVKFGQLPQTKAFAIIDDDKTGHGEWQNDIRLAPHVTPGKSVVVEWNEMYSIGSGRHWDAHYASLAPGNYQLRAVALDVMGNPVGPEIVQPVQVREPYWKTPWFWSAAVVLGAMMTVGASRYFIWHKMRREVNRLKEQRALEQERLRIARDIHDDLGARVTQISLLSALSQGNAAFPAQARAEFDKISTMSRQLVSALYETVWTVNPENDNLEALGNYLCQMVNKLCEQSSLRCRFHALGLPADAPVASHVRHNISMAVKEAIHNVMKHASATEVTMRVTLVNRLLCVAIQDDGRGFDPVGETGGNGLNNMKERLASIGGTCVIESAPGHGTTIWAKLHLKPDESTLH